MYNESCSRCQAKPNLHILLPVVSLTMELNITDIIRIVLTYYSCTWYEIQILYLKRKLHGPDTQIILLHVIKRVSTDETR